VLGRCWRDCLSLPPTCPPSIHSVPFLFFGPCYEVPYVTCHLWLVHCSTRPFLLLVPAGLIFQSFQQTLHWAIASRKCSSLDATDSRHNTNGFRVHLGSTRTAISWTSTSSKVKKKKVKLRGCKLSLQFLRSTAGNPPVDWKVCFYSFAAIERSTRIYGLRVWHPPSELFSHLPLFSFIYFVYPFWGIRWVWLMMILSALRPVLRGVCVAPFCVCALHGLSLPTTWIVAIPTGGGARSALLSFYELSLFAEASVVVLHPTPPFLMPVLTFSLLTKLSPFPLGWRGGCINFSLDEE